MGQKSITGLVTRSGIWHIDKRVRGFGRLCESCNTGDRQEAERYLIHRLDQIRKSTVYKERSPQIFRIAATKFLLDFQHQPSISDTAMHLQQLDPFIGDTFMHLVDDAALAPFIAARLAKGVSNRTINIALQRVVRILRLAATKWKDEFGMTWIDRPPAITMMPDKARRPAYPLSWEEQTYLLQALPGHIERMALYKANSGCREQEVCRLRWDWEVPVPELGTSVFIIPADFGGRRAGSGVKNGEERLVVLNDIAMSVIDGQRGKHKDWVFPYKGRPIKKMNSSGWRHARAEAAARWKKEKGEEAHPGFRKVRVHDLKHTFGRRLRAAGVSFEDRQVLLGHKSGSVTTEYSAPELAHLIAEANKVAATDGRSAPVLTLLKRRVA